MPVKTTSLDSWITGSYGEDHPGNQQTPEETEADRLRRARLESDACGAWQARRTAWAWIFDNCNGIDNVGLCPICGERVQVLSSKITMDARLIGSCGDAFSIDAWEKD